MVTVALPSLSGVSVTSTVPSAALMNAVEGADRPVGRGHLERPGALAQEYRAAASENWKLTAEGEPSVAASALPADRVDPGVEVAVAGAAIPGV